MKCKINLEAFLGHELRMKFMNIDLTYKVQQVHLGAHTFDLTLMIC